MPNGSANYSKPNNDVVEFNLFGRGMGECAAIHVGNGEWVVIDSCLGHDGKRSAILDYFSDIDIQPKSVTHIFCSHFDRDHIMGMPSILEFAPDALVIVPTPLSERDFSNFVAAHGPLGPSKNNSALYDVYSTLISQNRSLEYAHARSKFSLKEGGDIFAIAPSSKEHELFLEWIGTQAERFKKGLSAATPPSNNSVSLVLVANAMGRKIICGGDCLMLAEPDRGWLSAVKHLDSAGSNALLYKIAHHGAKSGDYPELWIKHLAPEAIVCLSPYNGGGAPVPSDSDVATIVARQVPAYSSAKIKSIRGFSHNYTSGTQRLAERMSSGRVSSAIKTFGHLRVRWMSDSAVPEISTFGDASLVS